MGIPFFSRPLDCEPFIHGYDMECSEAQVVTGIWDLPTTDMAGTKVKIPFYLIPGSGFLLLGNEICHQSYLMGPKNLFIIPPGVRNISKKALSFETYSEPTSSTDSDAVRTFLLVVPSKSSCITSYFNAHSFLAAQQDENVEYSKRFNNGKVAKRFANKLHVYTHLHLEDMFTLCRRAGVLTPVLRQALSSAFDRCTSCKSTGRPLQSKKVSFGKVLADFNQNVQVDFFFITELTEEPILHIVDTNTAFSAAALVPSRRMDLSAQQFEYKWINIHGAPQIVSGDLEFFNNRFSNAIRYFGCTFQPRPARRHNKLGVVERRNAVVRLIAQRLHKDASHFSAAKGSPFQLEDIISRASYMSNVLYGSKTLSSFEMARGYTASIMGLPQIKLSTDILEAQKEQEARRKLLQLQNSRSPHPVNPDALSKDAKVYFFQRGPKFGKWEVGYIRDVHSHSVSLSTSIHHKGKPIRAAYEDIRLVPSSPLLRDLDEIDFIFPRSYSIVDEEALDVGTFDPPLEEVYPQLAEIGNTTQHDETPAVPAHQEATNAEIPEDQAVTPTEDSNTELLSSEDMLKAFEEEKSLWDSHPTTYAFLAHQSPRRVNQPVRDVGLINLNKIKTLLSNSKEKRSSLGEGSLNTSKTPVLPEKDIGFTVVVPPPNLPHYLESSEQHILRQIKRVLGDESASESKLQFVPRWVLAKSIAKERSEYLKYVEEVDIRELPKDANVISSHHFFLVKPDGTTDKLKLKCRLVPHGNRDRHKHLVRTDSSTAQFPVIRLVLSTAATLL